MARKIRRLVPGESVGAHIFYSEEAEQAICAMNAAHYFIYRDPRDIVLSEAHFLAGPAKFHALHKYMKDIPSFNERVEVLICGVDRRKVDVDYPSISKRFDWYLPWITHSNVCAVKYEDLRGENLEANLRRIANFYASKANSCDESKMLDRARLAIDPSRSHTYRSGQTSDWKNELSERNKTLFKEHAGNLLIQLGYETDLDW